MPHGRAVIIIEACEESGRCPNQMPAPQPKPKTPLYPTTIIPNKRFSPDLPHYVMMLKQRIGTPSLIVCLDRYTLSLLHSHQNPSTHSTFSAAVAITTPCGSQRPCAGSLAAISRYPTLGTFSAVTRAVNVTECSGYNPQRGRALRLLLRRRPLLFPHSAAAVVSHRGRGKRQVTHNGFWASF